MISLRKHIEEMDATFGRGFLRAYRSLLKTLAECGPRAVPDLGDMLRRWIPRHTASISEAAREGDRLGRVEGAVR